MENNYQLSPFHYEPMMKFETIINKKPTEIQIQGNEMSILRALAKYKILNKHCINSCVKKEQPLKRQKASYDNEINLLFRGGYIIKYFYPVQINGRANTVLYALSQKGSQYVLSKNIKVSLRGDTEGKIPVFDTVSALETATLNSWHTRLSECYSPNMLTELYDYVTESTDEKNIVIPSFFYIKTTESHLFNELAVAAIVFKKERSIEAEGSFINTILAVNSFLYTNRSVYKNGFIVILVESFTEMERASVLIQSYSAFSNLQVYYAVDEYVNELSPLEWLYDAQNDEESMTTQYTLVYMMIQKKERK